MTGEMTGQVRGHEDVTVTRRGQDKTRQDMTVQDRTAVRTNDRTGDMTGQDRAGKDKCKPGIIGQVTRDMGQRTADGE